MKNEEPNVAPFSGLTDEQLKERKNATKASLEHWQNDILSRLNRGHKIINDYGYPLRWEGAPERVKCTSENCALCELFRENRYTVNCEPCPLRIVTQKPCDMPGSAWRNFVNNPTRDSAIGMVEALRRTYAQLSHEIQLRKINAIATPPTKAGYRVIINPLTTASTLEEAIKHVEKLRRTGYEMDVEILKIVEVSRPELKYVPKSDSAKVSGYWSQDEIGALIQYADALIVKMKERLGRTSSSVAYKLVSYLASEGVDLGKIHPLNKGKNKIVN